MHRRGNAEMKPEQFIRELGVERAKELISDPLHPKMTHVSDDGRHWVNENNKNIDENIRKQLPSLMRLEDLKRLVESLDIISDLDGIDAAKGTLAELIKLDWDEFEHRWIDGWRCSKRQLKLAIGTYESIYGGGDE